MVTINTNYSGKGSRALFLQAFTETETINKKLVTFLEDVSYKVALRKLGDSGTFSPYACGTGDSMGINLNYRELALTKYSYLLSICKDQLRKDYMGEGLGASAWNPNFPQNEQESILLYMRSAFADRMESIIWKGDLIFGGSTELGFIKLFENDPSVIFPVPAGAVTADNVVETLETVVSSAKSSILSKKDTIIAISANVATAYMLHLVKSGISAGFGGNANTVMKFGFYDVEVISALPDDTVVMYQKSNLFVGTDLMSDYNEIRIHDTDNDSTLTGEIKMKMVGSVGTQYAYSDEIVYYKGVL